jgi:hypothetical protein
MELKIYIGIIISKKERIGTRSEGPEYYIEIVEPNDLGQTELAVRKKVPLWQEDPILQPHVGQKVQLIGEPVYTKHVKFDGTTKSEGIIYKIIKPIG